MQNPKHTIAPLKRTQIEAQLKSCARLPSLSSINSTLRELLNADQRYTSQISEVIRRDPSLTAHLLRLVNSVYYGMSTPVNSIEEAVFYLGVRQIRQLAMVTPVIEDFQKLAGKTPFTWREFWQHCIATAIMTREIASASDSSADESDYLAGLVHDVGKIVMAATFPAHFSEIQNKLASDQLNLLTLETEILGLDHAELGALYLQDHQLPEVLVETARFHHRPEQATNHGPMVAAVQIADLLVRHVNIGISGNPAPANAEDCLQASGWTILFPQNTPADNAAAFAGFKRSLKRFSPILEGLV